MLIRINLVKPDMHPTPAAGSRSVRPWLAATPTVPRRRSPWQQVIDRVAQCHHRTHRGQGLLAGEVLGDPEVVDLDREGGEVGIDFPCPGLSNNCSNGNFSNVARAGSSTLQFEGSFLAAAPLPTW